MCCIGVCPRPSDWTALLLLHHHPWHCPTCPPTQPREHRCGSAALPHPCCPAPAASHPLLTLLVAVLSQPLLPLPASALSQPQLSLPAIPGGRQRRLRPLHGQSIRKLSLSGQPLPGQPLRDALLPTVRSLRCTPLLAAAGTTGGGRQGGVSNRRVYKLRSPEYQHSTAAVVNVYIIVVTRLFYIHVLYKSHNTLDLNGIYSDNK